MDDMGEWVNEVRLVGRVSGTGEERELPSGDAVVQLRVVVPRLARTGATGGARVDTIDVACWTARTRRSALRLVDGATVEVTGALRRRFFRAGPATVSRYEVEASRVAAVRAARRRGLTHQVAGAGQLAGAAIPGRGWVRAPSLMRHDA